jgi:hypothetical protein
MSKELAFLILNQALSAFMQDGKMPLVAAEEPGRELLKRAPEAFQLFGGAWYVEVVAPRFNFKIS